MSENAADLDDVHERVATGGIAQATVGAGDEAPVGDGSPDTATRSSARVRPWEAFRIPNFRYLWGNTFSFAIIEATEQFSFVWLMLELYDRGEQAGRIAMVMGLPVMLFSLKAGVMADRYDRRRLLMATQGCAALVSAIIATLLFMDRLSYSLTFVLAFLLGCTLAFGTPVRMATVPTVVPRHTLMNAIVLNGFAQNISFILGPALAGVMINTFDIKGAFTMSTVLYILGVLFLVPLRLPARVDDRAASRRQKGFLKDGLRFVVGHAGIRGLFLFLAIAAIFLIGPYGVLVPQLARVRLDRDVQEASLMFSMLGVGTILSTVIQASLGDLRRKGMAFLLTCAACGVMLGTVGLSTSYPVTLGLMVVWGIVGGFFMNLIQALIQSNTPHEFLGRVASVQTLSMSGIAPFGALLAGWGADTFEIMPWLLFSGACMVGSSVIVAFTQPAFRRM